MKIKCQRNNLLKGLQTVFRAVSTKNTLPSLSGILLVADKDSLTFQATDMEIAIQYREEDFELEEAGSLVLPGRYFFEIAKKLPDTELSLVVQNHTLMIKYENSEIEINGFDPEEFPVLPQVKGNIRGIFNLETLKQNLREVIIATSLDESRPIFTGILMEIEQERVNFIATDTHRLAFKKSAWEFEGEQEKAAVVIPNKILQEILKLGGEDNPNIKIFVDENQICFSVDSSLFISRLIEGKFPGYQQVIPAEEKIKTRVVVNGNHLLAILERATVMSRDQSGSRIGKVRLQIKGENMVVDSQSLEVGRIHEELPIYFEGEEMELYLNSRYLLDILKVADDDEIMMDLTGSMSPLILRRKDDASYLYLALPVKM